MGKGMFAVEVYISDEGFIVLKQLSGLDEDMVLIHPGQLDTVI